MCTHFYCIKHVHDFIDINEHVICNYIVWSMIIPFKGLGEGGDKGLNLEMERDF